MEFVIRPEKQADIAAIAIVTRAAFDKTPNQGVDEERIVSELRKTGQLSISLVAEQGNDVIGHVAVSPVSISDGTANWYGLGPISVSPICQRQGVGSALMKEALRLLQEQGASGCVVLGDPAYYSRFGFRPETGLTLPGVPAKYFQAISFEGRIPKGKVTYHQSFGA